MSTTEQPVRLSQQDFIANCICSESPNYYFVLQLDREMIAGEYRIPKRTVNNESEAIIDAYDWYIDINFSAEAEFQIEAEQRKETKKYPIVKFKWWYCVVMGFITILDGLTMLLTLGWFATGLALRFSLYGATKNIYRN